jgi:hypothetical protein
LKPQIPWLRVFVEGVVIVGSILLAFGIEAWWEGRQERVEEQEVLLSLEADLRRTATALDSVISRHHESIDVFQNLVRTLGSDPTPARADTIAESGWRLMMNTPFDGSVRTHDDLASSGRLGIIRGDSIRAALQDYAVRLKITRTWDTYIGNASVQSVEPAVIRRLPVSVRGPATDLRRPPFDPLVLFDDLEFWNLARMRLDNELGVLGSRELLLAGINEASRLVSKELSRR